MGIASGIGGQWGLKAESTVGTRVVPDRFLEFTKESLHLVPSRKASGGIRAGRHTKRRTYDLAGHVEGDIEFEFAPQSTGLIFKHTLGGVSTSGAGPYTHTFSHGVLDALGATIQIGRPSSDGTVNPFDYVGCQITKLDLAAKVDDILTGTMSVYGAYEDTGQSLASASYPSSWTPYTYAHGVLQIASSEVAVKDIGISIETGLHTGRHFIRSTTPQRPKASLSAMTRTITGTMNCDFEGLTAYNRFVNKTAASLSLVFTSGSNVLTISGNVEFTGDTPTIDGEDMLNQSLPFEFMHATSDSSAFSVVLVNSDSTP
jgi:hypothetical protein